MSEYKINETETTKNLETYARGFQDGWNLAMKQAKEEIKDFTEKNNGKIYPTFPSTPGMNAPWNTNFYDGCPVCGRKGPDVMICVHPKCPTRAYSGPIGAAGSDYLSGYPLGSNGANGPTGGDNK